MSSAAVPPPESPFEARPAPSVITDSASSAAATPSEGGVYAAKPIPVEFPLTSFSSTPHNVATFAFLLGACWSLGLVLAVANLLHWFLWTPKSLEHAASYLPKQGLWYAVTHSPQLGMYLASWAVFHMLEFVVTSMYNPGKLTVSCTSPILAWETVSSPGYADVVLSIQPTCSTMEGSTRSLTSPACSNTSSKMPSSRPSTVAGSTRAASSSWVSAPRCALLHSPPSRLTESFLASQVCPSRPLDSSCARLP